MGLARIGMLLVVGLPLLVAVVFIGLGYWSSHGAEQATGYRDGKLQPCGPAPNCVCSESGDIAPLVNNAADESLMPRLNELVVALGGVVVSQQSNYIHAEFTSRWFRFVDDVEILVSDSTAHIRSASRVGHSDLGANAARVARLRELFENTP